jgi:hypothetical protein
MTHKLYTIFDQPVVIFACRVNQSFTTHDQVLQVSYDNPSGTLASVLAGMSVWVGSTAGAWDLGRVYVRKTPTASVLYVGETSEIAWADNLYLTVVDDFSLWPVHPRISELGTILMGGELSYSDQHTNFDPVPVLGPDKLTKFSGASVSVILDASASWVFGSTISTYAWTVVSGVATLSNANTATPTVTVTAARRVMLRCLVTAANGKSRAGYRLVNIYDEAVVSGIAVVSARWSTNQALGGWEAELTVQSQLTSLPPRAKVLIVDEDGNLCFSGWVKDETVRVDQIRGAVSLRAETAQSLLAEMIGFSVGLERVDPATAWTQMPSLSVDRIIWHLLAWRTTLTNCLDLYLSGDTRQAVRLESPSGSIWEQCRQLAEETILARPSCSAQNQLYLKIDTALTPDAERSGIATVLSLTADDYEIVDLDFNAQPCSRIELSGVTSDGASLFSLAPGHLFARFGAPKSLENLLLSSQAQANELAGLCYARENLPFRLTADLLVEAQGLDLAQNQRISLVINSADNFRAVAYNGYVLPRSIDYVFQDGILDCQIGADPETEAALNLTGDIPQVDNEGVELPPWVPPTTPPITIENPPLLPPGINYVNLPACGSGEHVSLNWSKPFLSGSYVDRSAFSILPCSICPASAGGARLEINALLGGDAGLNATLYAINSLRQRIMTAVREALSLGFAGYLFTFNPIAQTNIGGFELEIAEGGADLYTRSLLHFEGGDGSTVILDETGRIWTVSGAAQLDTAQKKFGISSAVFDGSTAYITTPASPDFDLGTISAGTNFTVDFWIYINALGLDNIIMAHAVPASGGGGVGGWVIKIYSGMLEFTIGKNVRVDPWVANWQVAAPSTGAWHHIACIIESGVSKIYIDGILQSGAWYTPSSAYATGLIGFDTTRLDYGLRIGQYPDESPGGQGPAYLDGYLDEVRISAGIARWTADFTPPLYPYPSIGRTIMFVSTYAYGISNQI